MHQIPESELLLNPDGSIYHLGIRPEQLADTVLTVGDPERVPRISRYFDEIEVQVTRREFVIHTGYYQGQRLTVMSTGMGTDNIDIVLNELDALVNIDLETRTIKPVHKKLNIIRIGTSGALQPDIPLGAHLASAGAFGLDTLMHSYCDECAEEETNHCLNLQEHMQLTYMPYYASASQKLLQLFEEDCLTGVTATCAGFYGPQGRSLRLPPRNQQFIHHLSSFRSGQLRVTNFEMETAGYYALGRLLGHEVLSMNALLVNRLNQQFAPNPNEVVVSLIEKVLSRVLRLQQD